MLKMNHVRAATRHLWNRKICAPSVKRLDGGDSIGTWYQEDVRSISFSRNIPRDGSMPGGWLPVACMMPPWKTGLYRTLRCHTGLYRSKTFHAKYAVGETTSKINSMSTSMIQIVWKKQNWFLKFGVHLLKPYENLSVVAKKLMTTMWMGLRFELRSNFF